MRYVIYARVSTALDEQQSSYDVQTQDLRSKVEVMYPEYEYVRTYGDLGISGTKEDRESFQQMLEDTDDYDLIITKSISRFARNTKLLLNTISQLEAKGVHILFLEENIHTGSVQQKFLLTVLGALAEMESNNLRAHIKEGYAIRRTAGKMARPSAVCMGYMLTKDADGNTKVEINENEAKIVREIFKWYTQDSISLGVIAKKLRAAGYTSRRGKVSWARTTVRYILTNRKYTGDATEMGGEYVFEGAYPQIIDHETFEKAQRILKARDKEVAKMNIHTTNNFKAAIYPLSGIITCKKCGQKFTRYASHGENDAIGDLLDPCKGTPVWGCMNGSTHIKTCDNYGISEQYLYEMIIEAIDFYARKGGADDLFAHAFIAASMEDTLSFSTEEYEKKVKLYQEQKKELEKKRKRELDMYRDGLVSRDELTARVKKIEREIDQLEVPKTDDVVQVNKEHLLAFFDAMSAGIEDTKVHLRELFKDREVKRSIVRAVVDHIEIGYEPPYCAAVYLKNFISDPVVCYVKRRGPYRRHRREGLVEVFDPIQILPLDKWDDELNDWVPTYPEE